MAYVKTLSESIEVEDGSLIRDAAEELGVPFGCREGNCGTCLTTILKGMESLHPLTEKEEDFGLRGNERLICQCRIRSGEVVLNA